MAHWQAALSWYKVLAKLHLKEDEQPDDDEHKASFTAAEVVGTQVDQDGEAQEEKQVEKGKQGGSPPALQQPVDNQDIGKDVPPVTPVTPVAVAAAASATAMPVSAVSPAAEAINKAATESELRVVSNVAQAEGIKAGTFHQDAAWQFEFGAEAEERPPQDALEKMAEDLVKRKPQAAVAKAVKDGTGEMEEHLKKIKNTEEPLGQVTAMQNTLKKQNEAPHPETENVDMQSEKPMSEVSENTPCDSDSESGSSGDREATPPKTKPRGQAKEKAKAKSAPKSKGKGKGPGTAKAKAKREPKKKASPKRKAAAKSNTMPKSFSQTLSSQAGVSWQHWPLPVLRDHLFSSFLVCSSGVICEFLLGIKKQYRAVQSNVLSNYNFSEHPHCSQLAAVLFSQGHPKSEETAKGRLEIGSQRDASETVACIATSMFCWLAFIGLGRPGGSGR